MTPDPFLTKGLGQGTRLPLNAERGAELLLGQLPWMGVNFRLAGGAKGTSSRRTAKVELVLPFSHST